MSMSDETPPAPADISAADVPADALASAAGRGGAGAGAAAAGRPARTAQGLLELMRFSFYYAIHSRCDDVVIGVHPEHAPFYRRIFGFELIGDVRKYPIVKDNPATLLRFNLQARTQLDPLPRGLWFFAQNELAESVFAPRFLFDDPGLQSSLIARFLAYKRAMARAAA